MFICVKFHLTWSDWCLCLQSLDSSCDMMCLKERIQKSQEEREKQTLQQTGNTAETFPLTPWALVKLRSVKHERLPLLSLTRWRIPSPPSPFPFIVSFFRHGRGGGDDMPRRCFTFYYRPRLLLSGVCTQGGGPLPSVQSSGEILYSNKCVNTLCVQCVLYVCAVFLIGRLVSVKALTLFYYSPLLKCICAAVRSTLRCQ